MTDTPSNLPGAREALERDDNAMAPATNGPFEVNESYPPGQWIIHSKTEYGPGEHQRRTVAYFIRKADAEAFVEARNAASSPARSPEPQDVRDIARKYAAVIAKEANELGARIGDDLISPIASEIGNAIREAALAQQAPDAAQPVGWRWRVKGELVWHGCSKSRYDALANDERFDREAIFGAPPRPDAVREALEKARGCFEAAWAEGLNEKLYERSDINEPGSLADLVERRILHAQEHIDEALIALSTPAPSASAGLLEAAELAEREASSYEATANNSFVQDEKDQYRGKARVLERFAEKLRTRAADRSAPSADGSGAEWRTDVENAPYDARIIAAWHDSDSLPPHIELAVRHARDSSWRNTYGSAFGGPPTHYLVPPLLRSRPGKTGAP